MSKELPRFADEDQEREFWSETDSTEYVDWDRARKVVLPNLKPSQIKRHMSRRVKSKWSARRLRKSAIVL